MLQRLKTFLSYIFPFVTRKSTMYSGNMKIKFMNGKKVLNTPNDEANYSYGSLHRIMRFALREMNFSSPDDILLLGLGGGSAIALIRDEFYLPNTIRAVDIDPAIIQIARDEFALDSYTGTEIICQDAYDFVRETPEKHGLIIIDLFISNKVPEKFFDDVFWENIARILTPTGYVIFNTIIKTTNHELFDSIIARLEKMGFSLSVHDKVDVTNLMILAKRG
ncbi:MAG: fused MFS/spermidine synthase [Candidatus Gracilibacteria bacterium]|nr:fused MFS/spermidine synthase [Candidatus Gracilibacteria bacterium]